ncbi:MAG: DUF1559 domain-containing protein, partial [Pirellulaceae bacterium]
IIRVKPAIGIPPMIKTTIEILIVFAIAILLAMMFLPGCPDDYGPRPRTDCANNIRQIVLAMHNYYDTNGHFPPAVVFDAKVRPMHSWRTLIMPYMEMNDAYNKYDFNQPWDSPHNRKVAEMITDTSEFQCPTYQSSDGRHALVEGYTNYLLLTGPGTLYARPEAASRDDVTDGESQTIVIVEVARSDIHWMEPRDISRDEFLRLMEESREYDYQNVDQCSLSRHPFGINVAFIDGSVCNLNRRVDRATLEGLTSIAGGETVANY